MKETNYGTFNSDGFVWRREKGRGLGVDENNKVKKIACRLLKQKIVLVKYMATDQFCPY